MGIRISRWGIILTSTAGRSSLLSRITCNGKVSTNPYCSRKCFMSENFSSKRQSSMKTLPIGSSLTAAGIAFFLGRNSTLFIWLIVYTRTAKVGNPWHVWFNQLSLNRIIGFFNLFWSRRLADTTSTLQWLLGITFYDGFKLRDVVERQGDLSRPG